MWYDYYRLLGQIQDMGGIVRDVKSGMVDFFSIHDGREICLCWTYGEEKIRYWHEADDEFEERKPISLLKARKL